jgi:hypothetical protein
MFKKIILASFILMLGLIILSPVIVNAQDSGLVPADHGGCPVGYTGNCGNYELNDFIILAINISRWILGIVGSLTLLMFIYGGFIFLISAGSNEKIGEAKKIITAAVIGLLIVLGSFLIIKFVLSSMGITWNGEQIDITKVTTSN